MVKQYIEQMYAPAWGAAGGSVRKRATASE